MIYYVLNYHQEDFIIPYDNIKPILKNVNKVSSSSRFIKKVPSVINNRHIKRTSINRKR